MFLKSDGLKKSDSKCDLMAEKCDTIDVDSLDLVSPRKQQRKWPIFNILFNVILLVAVLSLAAWTMMCQRNPFSTLSSPKIEDIIFKTTMEAVDDAEAALKMVRQQSRTLHNKNRDAALEYIAHLRDIMEERSQWGVEKVKTAVDKGTNDFTEELLALRTTLKDVSGRLVDIALSEIEDITDSVASPREDENPAKILDVAITRAEDEVEALWNGLDQMYTFYTNYWTDLTEQHVQNMTEKIIDAVNGQKKICDCTLYDRVNMCYNISLANIETSKTVESMVQLMDQLYNTTVTVNNLQSLYTDADQHAGNVIEESKSLLLKYQQTSHKTLYSILFDEFCFLGSAVRLMAGTSYPFIKRIILTSWKTSIANATSAFNLATADRQLVKDEYRAKLIDDVEERLSKLRDEILKKISLLPDENVPKSTVAKRANFDGIRDLMNNRFKNLTEVTNSLYDSALTSAGESLKFYVDFVTNQKLPYLPGLTIQNYLPSDVCPVATDFKDYMSQLLNDAEELQEILSPNAAGSNTAQGSLGSRLAALKGQTNEDVARKNSDSEISPFVPSSSDSLIQNEKTNSDSSSVAGRTQVNALQLIPIDNIDEVTQPGEFSKVEEKNKISNTSSEINDLVILPREDETN